LPGPRGARCIRTRSCKMIYWQNIQFSKHYPAPEGLAVLEPESKRF
jgi:hypothetical protein